MDGFRECPGCAWRIGAALLLLWACGGEPIGGDSVRDGGAVDPPGDGGVGTDAGALSTELPFPCLIGPTIGDPSNPPDPRCREHRGDDQPLRVVVHSGRLLTPILSIGTGISLNDSGDIAFTGRRDDRVRGVFVEERTGRMRTVIDATDVDYGEMTQINNRGQVAFRQAYLDGLQTSILRMGRDSTADFEIVVLTGARITSPFATVEPFFGLNNEGRLTFVAPLNNAIPGPRVLAASVLVNNGGNERREDYFVSAAVGTAGVVPVLTDTGQTVTRLEGAAGGALYRYTGITFSAAESFADERDFLDVGGQPGVSDDGHAVAFMGAHRRSGVGIWLDVAGVRVKVAGMARDGFADPGEVFDDRDADGVLDLGEDDGPLGAFSLAPKVAVNRLYPNSSEWYRVAFLGWSQGTNLLGLYVSDVDARDPFALVASAPRRVLQQGDSVPGLPGKVERIVLHDAVNNVGRLAFWVATDAAAAGDWGKLSQEGRLGALGACHNGSASRVCAVLTSGPVAQIARVWSDQFPGVANNVIAGAAGLESDAHKLGNNLFLAVRADDRAYIKAEVVDPPAGLLVRLLRVDEKGEEMVNGLDNQLVGTEARLVTGPLTFSGLTSYRVVSGVDGNGDGDLSIDEVGFQFPGWVRVISRVYYNAQQAVLLGGAFYLASEVPIASRLVAGFLTGNVPAFAGVSEGDPAKSFVVCDTMPPLERCVTSPCRCRPAVDGVVRDDFALDHHVGVTFHSSTPYLGPISHYEFDRNSMPATAVRRSEALRGIVRETLAANWDDVIAGASTVFRWPLVRTDIDFTCPAGCEGEAQDLRLSLGSFAVVEGAVDVVVDRSGSGPRPLSVVFDGALVDLYDFRWPSFPTGGGGPRAAATVQTGHGTLSANARAGRVFTHRIDLSGPIDPGVL